MATIRRISVSRSDSRGTPLSAPAGRGRQPPELAEHERGEAGGEHRVAVGGAPDRVQELRARRGLQQVAERARLHCVEHVLLLAARGQDEDAHRGVGRVQAAGHFDPGHVR